MYVFISIFRISHCQTSFFFLYVLNIVKKRCCLQYGCHCVAFTLPTTPKIYVKWIILPPGFPDFKSSYLLNIWFSVYGFYINFESFFMLFPTIQKIFTFLEKNFYLLGGLMTSSRDHQNYKNVTIVFFFHYFPIRNISMNKICLKQVSWNGITFGFWLNGCCLQQVFRQNLDWFLS